MRHSLRQQVVPWQWHLAMCLDMEECQGSSVAMLDRSRTNQGAIKVILESIRRALCSCC